MEQLQDAAYAKPWNEEARDLVILVVATTIEAFRTPVEPIFTAQELELILSQARGDETIVIPNNDTRGFWFSDSQDQNFKDLLAACGGDIADAGHKIRDVYLLWLQNHGDEHLSW